MSTDESRPTQLGRFCTNSNHHRSWMFFFISVPVFATVSRGLEHKLGIREAGRTERTIVEAVGKTAVDLRAREDEPAVATQRHELVLQVAGRRCRLFAREAATRGGGGGGDRRLPTQHDAHPAIVLVTRFRNPTPQPQTSAISDGIRFDSGSDLLIPWQLQNLNALSSRLARW